MSDVQGSSGVRSVVLPGGLLHDGVLETDAEVIGMTGKVRKQIASPNTRDNPSKILDAILSNCVRRVGKFDDIRQAVLDALLVGDRDFLAMEIRRASLGDEVIVDTTCDGCKERVTLEFNIGEVEIIYLSEISHRLENDEILVDVNSKDLGVESTFALPTGKQQRQIARLIRINPIDANLRLYRMCVRSWNGTPGNELSPLMFEDMDIKILDWLDAEFSDMQPGPDFRITSNCPFCSSPLSAGMLSSDFLYPRQKREKI